MGTIPEVERLREVGLFGGLSDAIDQARKLAKAPGLKASVYPPPKTFMEVLGEAFSQDPEARVLSSFAEGRLALQLHALLSREPVLALCPVSVNVR